MNRSSDMAERHSRILQAMTEQGAELMGLLHEDARSCEDPKDRPEAVAAWGNVARALRHAIALEEKLVRAAEARAEDRMRDLASRSLAARSVGRPANLPARRDAVRKVFRAEIEAEQPEPWLSDLMRDEVDVYLDDPTHARFIAEAPIGKVLETLRTRLGLAEGDEDEGTHSSPSRPAPRQGFPGGPVGSREGSAPSVSRADTS